MVYVLYGNAATIFFTGRAFVDLGMKDNTHTWTMWRCVGMLAIKSCSTLLITIGMGSMEEVAPYAEIGLALDCVYIALLFMTGSVCMKSTFGRYTGDFKKRFSSLSHEECVTILISITLIVFAIVSMLLPLLCGLDGDADVYSTNWNPCNICGDLLIRILYSSTLALVPSLFMKHKAVALQRDLDIKSLFVRNVAHEIRTPLNITVVGLDCMRRSKLAAASQDIEEIEVIDEIMDSCKVAVTILDDLLAYEKISTGALRLDRADVNVVKFIRTAASLFNIQARSKNIRMSVLENSNLIDDKAYIHVDFGKMTQVLRNFISNAIKFTPENGHIRIEAYEERVVGRTPRIFIRVVDSGVGMTQEQQSQLFHEIVQFDVNTLQGGGGSGIGLWVTKKIIDLHGGQVQVSSGGPGTGSTFELSLPRVILESGVNVCKVHPAPMEEISSPAATSTNVVRRMIRSYETRKSFQGQVDKPFFSHMRVLVVDDSRLNRKFVMRLLSPCNFDFDEAEDGVACIGKVEASMKPMMKPFDLILMDVCTLS
jgi:signal transduction histidine kinase